MISYGCAVRTFDIFFHSNSQCKRMSCNLNCCKFRNYDGIHYATFYVFQPILFTLFCFLYFVAFILASDFTMYDVQPSSTYIYIVVRMARQSRIDNVSNIHKYIVVCYDSLCDYFTDASNRMTSDDRLCHLQSFCSNEFNFCLFRR